MRIRVMKTDRTVEPYLHTKVLGSFHHALSTSGHPDLFTAEQMAEAITFYLYSHQHNHTITTDEIYLMVQAILQDTGFPVAAQAINEHRLQRKLQRKRIEVVEDNQERPAPSPWSKSILVEYLIKKYRLNRPLARAIAGSVEEKVMRMGVSRIRKNLIRELVETDTEAMLRAEQQLKVTL